MQNGHAFAWPFSVGSPSWDRTSDLRINSPSLYQLSYRGRVVTLGMALPQKGAYIKV